MRMQVFWVLLVALGLTTGCLLRQSAPVSKEKNIGRALDEFARGTDFAKGTEGWANASKNVRKLVEKSTAARLTDDEVGLLAANIMEGGSQAIRAFKHLPMMRVNDLTVELARNIAKRVKDGVSTMPPSQRQEYTRLFAANDAEGVAAHLQKHTALGEDAILTRIAEWLGRSFDEAAETIADSHLVADAVAKQLKNNATLRTLGISADEIAAELKLGAKDFGLAANSGAGDVTDMLMSVVQKLTGVDVWREHIHLKLLLQRADDGKPAYEALSKADLQKIREMGIPFDKDLTIPLVKRDDQGQYLDFLYRKKGSKQLTSNVGGKADSELQKILDSIVTF